MAEQAADVQEEDPIMVTANEVLNTIQKKNTVNKEDLSKILRLSGEEQTRIINKISRTRRQKLLEYLANIPYLEETFDFPLSRRESFNVTSSSHRESSMLEAQLSGPSLRQNESIVSSSKRWLSIDAAAPATKAVAADEPEKDDQPKPVVIAVDLSKLSKADQKKVQKPGAPAGNVSSASQLPRPSYKPSQPATAKPGI